VAYVEKTFVPGQIKAVLGLATTAAATLVGAEATVLAAETTRALDGVKYLERELTAGATAIDGTLTRELWPTIDNLTREMGKLWPLALPLAFPALMVTVQTLEATLGDAMSECVNPTCNALTPFLSMLNILQDVAILTGLAVIFEEAVTHPHELAVETAAVADDILGIGKAFASAMTGLGL
jgi:hypothetical protein